MSLAVCGELWEGATETGGERFLLDLGAGGERPALAVFLKNRGELKSVQETTGSQ